MQKDPANSSENDCFADDAVEEAEETDTLCRQCPLEDDRFATCGLLMTSICSEAVKKNCNNWLTQRLEEAAAEYGMEISSDKSKPPVNSIKPRRSTNKQMNGNTLEENT